MFLNPLRCYMSDTDGDGQSSRDKYELKQRLAEVQELEGRGTELVSLYIPDGKSINPYRGQMQEEHAQADNIKSDRTRKSVQSALSKVSDILKRYQSTPEGGLVVFAGRANGDMVEYVFDNLPRSLNHSDYVCSDHFVTEPLERLVAPESSYGLVVLDRNEATLGKLIGERVEVLQHMKSGVMGKSKAGGQSAARFERVREKQKENFFRKVGNNAKGLFVEDNELVIDGLLLGGTDITVDDFLNGSHLDYRLDENLLGKFNISYGNERGLNELVDKAQDILQNYEEQQAKEQVDRFWNGLSDDETAATYGRDKVEQALDYGAVDTLLLSNNVEPDVIDELSEQTEQQGGDVVIVPTTFERGESFWRTFDGIGAVLRYEVFHN